MVDLKSYRNKNIGHFTSFPASLIDDSSPIDSIYLAVNFEHLHTKSVARIRASGRYGSTLATWQRKLKDVDTSDLAVVAEKLGFDIEVFDPLTKSPQIGYSGGRYSKGTAQLLKVKSGVFKPILMAAPDDAALADSIEVLFHMLSTVSVKNKVLKMLKKEQYTQGGAYSTSVRVPQHTPRLQSDMYSESRPAISNIKSKPNRQLKTQMTVPVGNKNRLVSFGDLFVIRSMSQSDMPDEEVRSEISRINKRPDITVDMIIAYLTIGTKPCRHGLIIESNNDESHDHASPVQGDILDNGRHYPISCICMSSTRRFMKGSSLWVNLEELKARFDTIERGILANFDHVRRMAHEAVHHILQNDEFSGGDNTGIRGRSVFDYFRQPTISNSPEQQFYTPDTSPINDTQGTLEKESMKKESDTEEYDTKEFGFNPPSDMQFLAADGQSFSKGGQRHVMKICYCKESSCYHVVVKAALNEDGSEQIDTEGTIYGVFKSSYVDFYEKNVLPFYGGGITGNNQEINFVDGDDDRVSINLLGSYENNSYIVTEYDPSVVDLGCLLKSQRETLGNRSPEYQELCNDYIQHVTWLHKEANEVCEFGHGDLKPDNLLVDRNTGRVKIFDLELSSISGYISAAYKDMYQNEYLTSVVDGKVEYFETKYLWYFDAIRFLMAHVLFEYYDLTVEHESYDDIELQCLVESIKERIAEDHDILLGWNTTHQSDEFITTIMKDTKRKLNKNDPRFRRDDLMRRQSPPL